MPVAKPIIYLAMLNVAYLPTTYSCRALACFKIRPHVSGNAIVFSANLKRTLENYKDFR